MEKKLVNIDRMDENGERVKLGSTACKKLRNVRHQVSALILQQPSSQLFEQAQADFLGKFVNNKRWKPVTEQELLKRRWKPTKKVLNVPDIVDGSGVSCYRCHKKHMVKNCPVNKIDPKCFECNRMGHKAAACNYFMTVRANQSWEEFKMQRDVTLARKRGEIGPAAAVCKNCGRYVCCKMDCYNCGKRGHSTDSCSGHPL